MNPPLPESDARGLWLRESGAALWRGRWIVGAITALTLAGALAYSLTQDATYESGAKVVVFTVVDPDGNQVLPEMQTEQLIAHSPLVARAALRRLGPVQEVRSVNGALRHLSVTSPINTQILEFTYSDHNATDALEYTRAFADAYLAVRRLQLHDSLGAEIQERAVGRVIQPATVPGGPSSPNTPLTAVLAVILGLAVGTGVVLTRERLKGRLRGRRDLERSSGASALGTIPPFSRRLRGNLLGLWVHPERISPTLEAYRSLRTGLLVAASARGAKSILVTSSTDGEGKTTMVANLGSALAEIGKRVVLVSADLRRPQLDRLFGSQDALGLSEVVAGEVAIDHALVDTGVPGMRLLPSGKVSMNRTQLLVSKAMRTTLAKLREEADIVLIDAAPVLGTSDAIEVVPFVDAVLFVADPERVEPREVARACRQLELVHAVVLGSVLNRFDEGREIDSPYVSARTNGHRTTSLEGTEQEQSSPSSRTVRGSGL